MKLLASLTILGLVMAQSVTAQTNYTKDPESCTSIMVGKKATTDGSVDRKSTRLNSSHWNKSRMPSSA